MSDTREIQREINGAQEAMGRAYALVERCSFTVSEPVLLKAPMVSVLETII